MLGGGGGSSILKFSKYAYYNRFRPVFFLEFSLKLVEVLKYKNINFKKVKKILLQVLQVP